MVSQAVPATDGKAGTIRSTNLLSMQWRKIWRSSEETGSKEDLKKRKGLGYLE